MRAVTFSMAMSLDGYIAAPGGDISWGPPDDDMFRFATDEVRELSVHLMGRRLYESMLYGETPEPDASPDPAWREFARIWKALPKVVFSTTLQSVEGNARLASAGLDEEIARLRAEPGDGDIAIGGATLVAAAAELDLIDEYRPRVHPVLLGAGTPFFPRAARRQSLELLDERVFSSGVVVLRYRVAR